MDVVELVNYYRMACTVLFFEKNKGVNVFFLKKKNLLADPFLEGGIGHLN